MQAYLPPHSDRPLHLGEAPTLHLAPLTDRIRLLQNDLETRPLTPDQVSEAWREIAHELAHYESPTATIRPGVTWGKPTCSISTSIS